MVERQPSKLRIRVRFSLSAPGPARELFCGKAGDVGPLPLFGAVVQLVRMSACHAEGHGFESRQRRHL